MAIAVLGFDTFGFGVVQTSTEATRRGAIEAIEAGAAIVVLAVHVQPDDRRGGPVPVGDYGNQGAACSTRAFSRAGGGIRGPRTSSWTKDTSTRV